MQSVYYPISGHRVGAAGDELFVVSNHDEFSLWFDVGGTAVDGQVAMPEPKAGIHLAASRSRLGQINDPARNAKLVAAVGAAMAKAPPNPVCLCVSELSLLGLMACKLGAGKVYVAEENRQMRDVMEGYASRNDIEVGKQIVFLEKPIAEVTPEDFDHEEKVRV